MNERLEDLEQFLIDCNSNWEINSMEDLIEKIYAWESENDFIFAEWEKSIAEQLNDYHERVPNTISYRKLWNILSDKLNELAEKDWYFNS